MSNFYRYELLFDGENQDVGFLVGLPDTGLSEAEVCDLTAHFDNELPIPDLFLNHPVHTKSYFTEAGNMIFLPSIHRIMQALPEPWSVCRIVVPEVKSKILYRDYFQIICEV